MNSKLLKELPELVNENVISQDIAEKIESYYQSKQDSSPNRLFAVFGVLGSLLVGLGIILVLAHNWDDFSRTTKTIISFLPLIIGQLLCWYSIFKKKSKTWKESSGTFLFFAVGSSVSLIAQTYNIPGDMSSLLLTWVILCIPLIYLLNSNSVALLCLIFVTWYAGDLGYGYLSNGKTPWLYLVLMASMVPHYLQLQKQESASNITSVFNWLFPLSLIITLGTFVNTNNDLGILMYVILFGAFYNLGKIPFFDEQKLRRNGFLVLGSLGTVLLLLWLSFNWFWKPSVDLDNVLTSLQEFYLSIALFALALVVLLLSFHSKRIKRFNLFQFTFIFFIPIFFIGTFDSVLPIVLVNMLVFILGLATVKIGADKFHFGILNYGLLIISALVICRFFDTNMTFLVRGVLFMVVGIGFFIANYLLIKRKSKTTN